MQQIASIALRKIGSDGHASPLGTARSGAGLEPILSYGRTAWRCSRTGGGCLGLLVEVCGGVKRESDGSGSRDVGARTTYIQQNR